MLSKNTLTLPAKKAPKIWKERQERDDVGGFAEPLPAQEAYSRKEADRKLEEEDKAKLEAFKRKLN